MQPPSLHQRFFSSLKHVEKRLKLESAPPLPPTPPSPENSCRSIESLSSHLHQSHQNASPPLAAAAAVEEVSSSRSTESLSSPIHLHFDQSSTLQDTDYSQPPLEFLTNSLGFREKSPVIESPRPVNSIENHEIGDDEDADIESLIQLLGLSDLNEEENLNVRFGCDYEFYDKIVGVRGPKSNQELERLDGWINYFLGEKTEPLRLAHLLLAKAAFFSSHNNGFEGLDFPETVDEFLQSNPPAGYC